MSGAYYLLNGELRFYFEAQNKTLQYNDQSTPVQNKEAQALLFALDNKDHFFTAEALAAHLWGQEAVDSDFFNKRGQAVNMISKLRRRMEKLKYKTPWLTTEENQGYQICCSVEYVSAEQIERKAKDIQQQSVKHHHRMNILRYGGSSAMLTVLLLIAIVLLLNAPELTVANTAPMPTLSGVSTEPKFSPDGRAIAFSYETRDERDQPRARIYLKLQRDINYRALSQGSFDQAPAFSPSGRQLAFHRWEDGLCEIRLLQLDEDYNKMGPDVQVAECNGHSQYSSITWRSEQVLFFTDQPSDDMPANIYQLDLSSREKSLYLAFEHEAIYTPGYYFVHFDQAGQNLFALEGEGYALTNVFHIAEDEEGKPLARPIKRVNVTLNSVAVYKDKLIFRDQDNQLKAFALDDPDEVSLIYANPLIPLQYPNISQTSQQITFTTGEYYQSKINRYDIHSGEHFEVIGSDFRLTRLKANDDELLVVTKETGLNQIQVYEGNTAHQLSSFKVNHHILALDASADKRWVAVNFADGTTLYARDQRGLTRVKHFDAMMLPSFSPSGQRLLLSVQSTADGTLSSLQEFDLSSYHQTGQIDPSGVDIPDAKFGVYYDKGIVYTPADRAGIYRFELGGSSNITAHVSPIHTMGFGVYDGYVYTVTQDKRIVKVNMETGVVESLPQRLHGNITLAQNSIFYISESLGNMDIVVADLVGKKLGK